MPWKNGQGSTLEIAIDPPGSGLSGAPFNWRLSIATVAASGPFSRFPGYERSIMLIEGNGMTIDAGIDGLFELTRFKPVAFSGDWHVTGHLADGPVRDFNLMFARRERQGSLEAVELAQPLSLAAEGGMVALYLLNGSAQGYGEGDTIILMGDETVDLKGAAQDTVGVLARLR
jgi:hypothetical protein